eukprot:15455809-Alexandrium_andersonii.AAC.1
MALILNDDPSWKAAVAPVIQWVKSCWKSVTGAGRGTTGLGVLCTAWRFMETQGFPGWGSIRGPVGAFMASLARIGWSCHDPLKLTDEHGVTRNVLSLSPKLWSLLRKDAYFRRLQLEAGRAYMSDGLR